MFYLKQFLKLSLRYPVKSVLFFISTMVLTGVILHGTMFKVWFWDHFGKVPFYPSFYALFTTHENNEYIRSKLMNLPNVVNVEYKEREEIKDEILGNLDEMGVPKEFAEFDFNILRIYLEKRINDKTIELMKEYLQRLVKDKNIIFTPLQKENGQDKVYKNDFMELLKSWGNIPLYFLAFSLWFFSFFMIVPDIRKFSYLVENFQRRRLVSSKIFLTGTFGISLLMFVTFIAVFRKVDFNFLMIFSFYLLIAFVMGRVKYDFSEKM